jgi:hypothetical protein
MHATAPCLTAVFNINTMAVSRAMLNDKATLAAAAAQAEQYCGLLLTLHQSQ